MMKYHPALGTWTNIRLCCFVRAMERLLGERFYEVESFEPLWEWNCDEMLVDKNGNVDIRGQPPAWLVKRFKQKGIQVKNLKERDNA